jgi:hypothetical protein
MPSTGELDTHHKALTLNLDTSAFGSSAEIGAGQEKFSGINKTVWTSLWHPGRVEDAVRS